MFIVATVLTVYGIETQAIDGAKVKETIVSCNSTYRLRYWNSYIFTNWEREIISLQQYLPFTVLKLLLLLNNLTNLQVATVLTVYGIETGRKKNKLKLRLKITLQQYLPFTVLKLFLILRNLFFTYSASLQQYLPFTVLKLYHLVYKLDIYI